MCLITKSKKPTKARKDRIVYKLVNIQYFLITNSNINAVLFDWNIRDFKGILFDKLVEGKIAQIDETFILFTNDRVNNKSEYDWLVSGYKYMTIINHTIIPKEFLIIKYNTYYRNVFISIPSTVKSNLQKIGDETHEGIHSFIHINDAKHAFDFLEDDVVIVECIVPKGSRYYKGKFKEYDSIASDTLQYVKIIT